MRTFWLATMILGFALEGFGLALAARGLLQTWRANAGDRPFFSPRFQRLFAWLRVHVLRRKPRIHEMSGTVEGRFSFDGSAIGVVDRALTEEMTLHEQVQVVYDIAVKARHEASVAAAAVEGEARKRRTAVAAIESRLESTSKALTAYAEGLVVDGVPLAVAGLACAAAGLALQGVASIAVF